ncbi:hypothetical protein ACFQZ4_02830 [Catellatospora coxensis]
MRVVAGSPISATPCWLRGTSPPSGPSRNFAGSCTSNRYGEPIGPSE